jgi:molybdopterin-guanine dinucleotide biosynthesis protein A
MGRDKALLPFLGSTLGESVAHRVELAAGSVVLVGNPSKFGGLGYEITPDLYPGEGPLGGILTVLQHTRTAWNLILACDMPAVTVEFLNGLLEVAEQSEGDALIPVGPSGRLEPLCAVYHRRARQPLYAAFAGGTRRITTALGKIRIAVHEVAEVALFQNVNTPEDWADYASKRRA